MSFGRLDSLRKTVGFRLALWYSGIFIFGSLLLFTLIYLLLSNSLKDQDRQAILLKWRELSAAYESDGIRGLKREAAIDRKFGRGNPFFIRMAGPDNKDSFIILPYQWVEFDLKILEKISQHEGLKWFRLPFGEKGYQLEVASRPLTGELLLQVGKSNEERHRTLGRYRAIFASVMAPVVLCGFISGMVIASRALRPIRHLIETVRSIDAGAMDARVSSPRTDDELDELVVLFNQMLTKIETLIRGMRDSLDSVAHDLRTPLTRLRGTAELALQSDRNPEALTEALADCLEEADQILKILNALMDISEAEVGLMKLDLHEVNASEIIEAVVELYRYVGEEKGITIEADCPKEIRLAADPTRLKQALGNLIDNSIKYSAEGSRIRLASGYRDKAVVFTVEDDGVGIEPREVPRIWDRFYRSERSRSERGLGLGLSIVTAIVKAHGGGVEVSSAPGKGSTFTIFLPVGGPSADSPV